MTLANAQTHHPFRRQSCGASHGKWTGRCEACGEWNTIVEEAVPESAPKGLKPAAGMNRSGNDFVDQFIHGRAEGPIKMELRRA